MYTEVDKIILLVNQVFTEAFARGDAEGVAALYTADAQLLPPNSEVITGQGPIAGFWRFVMGLGIKTVRLESSETTVGLEMAVEIGKYTLGDADGNAIDIGKYLVVWKNDGGGWKIQRDIWNTSMPA